MESPTVNSKEPILNTKNNINKKEWTWYFIILLIFVLLRVMSWAHTTQFEDHDSVEYLRMTKIFKSLNIQEIENFGPDSTYFYPIFSAIMSIPFGSVEVGARLCSLLFSIGLFFVLIFIGRKITNWKAIAVGLAIIAFSPYLIEFSIGVVTEPSYITVVYLGFLILWNQLEKPSIVKGFLLGIFFSLTFLNRTEGIIYIAVIPFIMFFYYFFWGRKLYPLKTTFSWSFVFIIGFLILTSLQIISVSEKMGTFAINGRQAWEAMLKNPDGKTYEQKKQGLDYSPSMINLDYIESHPEAYKNLVSSGSITHDIKLFVSQLNILYKTQLSNLVGSFVLIFFGIGIYYLIYKKKYFATFLIVFFIVISFIPPLMHDVALLHIAIVAPFIMMLAGIGIVFISDQILASIKSEKLLNLFKGKLEIIFILIMVILSVGWLNDSVRHGVYNFEYNPVDFKKPLAILKRDIKENNIQDPKVITRKYYFTYFAGVHEVKVPYTDYKGLVKYAELNHVNYLFLQFKDIKNYPFLNRFKEKDTPGFKLLYEGPDSFRNKIELYRMLKDTVSQK